MGVKRNMVVILYLGVPPYYHCFCNSPTAVIRKAVNWKQLTHQLLIVIVGLIAGRFPEVPTIRLNGFRCDSYEGLTNAGWYIFNFWAGPLG